MHLLKVLSFALACHALLSGMAVAQQSFDVTWVKGRLGVRAMNVPLVDLIREVSRVTGIEVIGSDKLTGLVSADFSALPAPEAMAALLGKVNHVVQERSGPNGRPLLAVTVYSMAGDQAAASAGFPTPPAPIFPPTLLALVAHEAAVEEEDLQEARDDDPDDVDEEERETKAEAAQLVGDGAFGPEASIATLAEHAANLGNKEIRLEALRALSLRPIEDALPALTASLDDDSLEVRTLAVEILGRAGDPESLTAMGRLVVKTQNRDVRISALRVLALRGDPASVVDLQTLRASGDLVRDPQVSRVVDEMLEEHDYRARKRQPSR